MNEQEEKMFGEEFDRWIDNADEQRKNGGYDCMVKTVNSMFQQRSTLLSQQKQELVGVINNKYALIETVIKHKEFNEMVDFKSGILKSKDYWEGFISCKDEIINLLENK